MEAPPTDDNRIYIYERTAVVDLVRDRTRDITEFYDPACNITFNIVDGVAHAWQGRKNLDYTPPPSLVSDDGYLARIAKVQHARNVRRGPPLTHNERVVMARIANAEADLAVARQGFLDHFGPEWRK